MNIECSIHHPGTLFRFSWDLFSVQPLPNRSKLRPCVYALKFDVDLARILKMKFWRCAGWWARFLAVAPAWPWTRNIGFGFLVKTGLSKKIHEGGTKFSFTFEDGRRLVELGLGQLLIIASYFEKWVTCSWRNRYDLRKYWSPLSFEVNGDGW